MKLYNDHSIFNISKYRASPVFTWMFLVSFINIGKNDKGLPIEEEDKGLQFMATNCKIPGITYESVETNYAGLKASFPGRITVNGILDITFNENVHGRVRQSLRKLAVKHFDINQLRNDDQYIPEHFNSSFNKSLKIDVDLFDYKGDNLYCYSFYNCYLEKIDDVPLTYDTKNQALQHKATFKYDYYEVNTTPIVVKEGKEEFYDKQVPGEYYIPKEVK